MADTVTPFPIGGPLKFTDTIRNALLGLDYERPRWRVAFGADDDGDEFATLTDAYGDGGSTFGVNAGRNGSLALWDRTGAIVGTFTTGDALMAELHLLL